MKRTLWGLALAGVAGIALHPAAAWEINPTENRDEQGDELGLIPFDPLHETITWNALDCALDESLARDASGLKLCVPLSFEERPTEPGNNDSPLIRGVWWNDDPEQLLNSINYPRFAVNMKRAERDARTPGEITPQSRMQYRSHYGDLQFLHAMATADGEPAGPAAGAINSSGQ
jgi:hypothetical protein